MRNAASILGIIGGLIGIIVGLFGYGYAELSERHAEVGELFGLLENPGFIRFASFIAPLLAIAGGAMAKSRALWGGILMLITRSVSTPLSASTSARCSRLALWLWAAS